VVTISFHLNCVHLKRNQRWRITPSVRVRLVARDVGVVHDPWIGDHRVDHRRRGEERGGQACHRRWMLRQGHHPVLPEVYALGELQPIVDHFGEILRPSQREENCSFGESENFYITKKYGCGCTVVFQKTFNVLRKLLS